MAPWRGQVWKIRERLRKEKLSGVDVGTVEVSRCLPSFEGVAVVEHHLHYRITKAEKTE